MGDDLTTHDVYANAIEFTVPRSPFPLSITALPIISYYFYCQLIDYKQSTHLPSLFIDCLCKAEYVSQHRPPSYPNSTPLP